MIARAIIAVADTIAARVRLAMLGVAYAAACIGAAIVSLGRFA